jgi:predicted nucleic acid-binding protein
MILADTSVWVDHLRYQDHQLSQFLQQGKVLGHDYVTGELAMGSLRDRETFVSDLRDLPQALIANLDELLEFVTVRRLSGLGLSFVDAHLLASTQMTPDAVLWTRDRRLHEAAVRLSLNFSPKLN